LTRSPRDSRTLTTTWQRISAPYDITLNSQASLQAQIEELTTGTNIDINGTQLSS
jgi:hypothetical protein